MAGIKEAVAAPIVSSDAAVRASCEQLVRIDRWKCRIAGEAKGATARQDYAIAGDEAYRCCLVEHQPATAVEHRIAEQAVMRSDAYRNLAADVGSARFQVTRSQQRKRVGEWVHDSERSRKFLAPVSIDGSDRQR